MSNKNTNFSRLYFVVKNLVSDIYKKIDDFEYKVYKKDIVKDFYNIEFIFMHSIVLDLAKLISAAGNDRSGLKQVKKHASEDVVERINSIFEKYKETFSKIKINRDKIIAHIDIGEHTPYFDLGFSETEVNRIKSDFKKNKKLHFKESQI